MQRRRADARATALRRSKRSELHQTGFALRGAPFRGFGVGVALSAGDRWGAVPVGTKSAPHFGHLPGRSARTPSCMGQV
jgi:hypothetical protein